MATKLAGASVIIAKANRAKTPTRTTQTPLSALASRDRQRAPRWEQVGPSASAEVESVLGRGFRDMGLGLRGRVEGLGRRVLGWVLELGVKCLECSAAGVQPYFDLPLPGTSPPAATRVDPPGRATSRSVGEGLGLRGLQWIPESWNMALGGLVLGSPIPYLKGMRILMFQLPGFLL